MTKKDLKQKADIAALENALALVKEGGSVQMLMIKKARPTPRNKK